MQNRTLPSETRMATIASAAPSPSVRAWVRLLRCEVEVRVRPRTLACGGHCQRSRRRTAALPCRHPPNLRTPSAQSLRPQRGNDGHSPVPDQPAEPTPEHSHGGNRPGGLTRTAPIRPLIWPELATLTAPGFGHVLTDSSLPLPNLGRVHCILCSHPSASM